MSEAIKVDEVDLLALLEIIYNIACIEIPTFFMEEKNKAILKEKIVSFEKSKDAIIIGILDELAGFYPKNAKEGDKKNLAISPDALLELFRKDPRVNYFIVFLIVSLFNHSVFHCWSYKSNRMEYI